MFTLSMHGCWLLPVEFPEVSPADSYHVSPGGGMGTTPSFPSPNSGKTICCGLLVQLLSERITDRDHRQWSALKELCGTAKRGGNGRPAVHFHSMHFVVDVHLVFNTLDLITNTVTINTSTYSLDIEMFPLWTCIQIYQLFSIKCSPIDLVWCCLSQWLF